MNITGKWLDQAQGIYTYKFMGLWTWAEYDTRCHEFDAILENHTTIIHIIMDMSATQYVPPGARLWAQGPAKLAHENKGLTLLVSANAYLRSLIRHYRMSPQDNGKALILCQTLDEALRYVQDNSDAPSN